MSPPIIVIGMHRSGTTILSRVLERLGLFVGWRKPHEYEARMFLELNEWLLRQCGATWDRPAAIHELWSNDFVRTWARQYCRGALRARSLSYLGPRLWLRHREVHRLPIPWGWKDPRNTFTLPLWLDLFPDAKVVHISRHGVDVANSLVVRTRVMLEYLREVNDRRRLVHWKISGKSWTISALRCTTREAAFSLWEEHVDEARRHVAELGDRAIELRFEDLVADPGAVLDRLARFCALPAPQRLDAVIGDLNADRIFAYRKDDEARQFADRVADRLAARGYTGAPAPSPT